MHLRGLWAACCSSPLLGLVLSFDTFGYNHTTPLPQLSIRAGSPWSTPSVVELSARDHRKRESLVWGVRSISRCSNPILVLFRWSWRKQSSAHDQGDQQGQMPGSSGVTPHISHWASFWLHRKGFFLETLSQISVPKRQPVHRRIQLFFRWTSWLPQFYSKRLSIKGNWSTGSRELEFRSLPLIQSGLIQKVAIWVFLQSQNLSW